MAGNPVSEEKMFADILSSMGIDKYDPIVPAALNEYARRLAAELLCDAKDYSVHAKKAEIDVDDVRLASMLSDTRVNGVEQSSAQLEEVKKSINQQNLVEFVDPEAVLVRYPPSMFTKQAITYVSSEEAYGEYYKTQDAPNYGNQRNSAMNVDSRYQYTGQVNFSVSRQQKSAQHQLKNAPGFEHQDD